MALVEQDGLHAHLELVAHQSGLGNHLEHLAASGDVRQDGGRDAPDAVVLDLLVREPGAKGDVGQNADLAQHVQALDVRSGVRLGEAQFLRGGQSVRKGLALAHAGEDKVGSAVHDAVDVVDAIELHLMLQGADAGDAAAYRRLAEEVDAVRLGQREKLLEVLADHLFVGGDDTLAVGQRLDDTLMRKLVAAHGLEDHVDVLGQADLVCITRVELAQHLFFVGKVEDLDGLDTVRLRQALHQRKDAAAYGSITQNTYFHLFLLYAFCPARNGEWQDFP